MGLAVALCCKALAAERAAKGSNVHVCAKMAPEVAFELLRLAAKVTPVDEIVPLVAAYSHEKEGVVLAQVEG